MALFLPNPQPTNMRFPIDAARMVPASENDVITPGTFYFACLNLQRKTESSSYWIVMRSPREWLPDGFFDTRPVQQRVFPFWITGRDQRVWLPRSSLFYLDRSQREIFNRNQALEFTNTFMLIESFQSAQAALIHFRRRILESTEQYNDRRMRLARDLASNVRHRASSLFEDEETEEDARGGRDPVGLDNRRSPKRQRRGIVTLKLPSSCALNTGSSSSPNVNKAVRTSSHASNPHTISSSPKTCTTHKKSSFRAVQGPNNTNIKSEHTRDQFKSAEDTMNNNRVCIYVGEHNKEIYVDATKLEKASTVLDAMVTPNDGKGEHILNLDLMHIDAKDFESVADFIQHGECPPTLMNDPQDTARRGRALEGCNTKEDYAEFLIKAGRQYILAKQFEVKGMASHIYEKITKGQWKTYSNIALIEFTRTLFTGNQHGFVAGEFNTITLNAEGTDPIYRWAVQQLAGAFMEIAQSEVEFKKYKEMEKETRGLGLHAVVLEVAAAHYRVVGGFADIAIEDSE